ncbi:MAG TPA: winged helix-turn-helix domain-containing protein [Nitrososphaerales archaeon]|nr:winged helix-turn-helix domain-containing protein [Nitrososphaerales archaeon]
MALVDDLVTAVLLASTAFFVALAFGLMIRYRQVSQKINSSTDLGRDLWEALEQRMKKQDERILDIMARLEVVQSRVLASTAVQVPTIPSSTTFSTPQAQPAQEVTSAVTLQPPQVQQPESHTSQVPTREIHLDETQLKVVNLLAESPRNTRQLTDAIGLSREHTARLMKVLFEGGVVTRNDSTKPFVYQLTDQGKRFLTPSG